MIILTDAVDTLDDARARGRYGATTYHVGDPIPIVLTSTVFAQLLGISDLAISRLEKAGELRPFEVSPRLGPKPTYSGKKIAAWLDGVPLVPADTAAPRVFRRTFQKGAR
jgi:hypothetical protein